MGSSPVEVANFFRVNLQLLKLQLSLRRSYLHLNLHFRSSHHLYSSIRISEQDKFLSLFRTLLSENSLDSVIQPFIAELF